MFNGTIVYNCEPYLNDDIKQKNICRNTKLEIVFTDARAVTHLHSLTISSFFKIELPSEKINSGFTDYDDIF